MGNVGSRGKGKRVGHNAAAMAREAAGDTNSKLFKHCSSLMCWDAVVACQVQGGMARPAPISSYSYEHVISMDDASVTNKYDMQQVPEGASMGFFRDGNLVHFMMSVGGGEAAGNKNECIGIGQPVGFEILDLANELDWQEQGFKDGGGRTVLVRYRSIDD